MKKEYKMSEERHQELKDELNYLKTVREKEVAELIKEARGFGDLSENSEYDEAKNEQGKLYSRIAEIEDILLHAVIITDSDEAGTSVTIGSRVTVAELASGRELPEYKVVGSQEADPMNRAISEDSPFGRALMGAKEGDEVVVEAPVGEIRYRIVKIERYRGTPWQKKRRTTPPRSRTSPRFSRFAGRSSKRCGRREKTPLP